MSGFKDIISFHNDLKRSMMLKLHGKEEIQLNIQTQAMTPGVFFNLKIKTYLHPDCLLINGHFFKQQFTELWKTLTLPLSRKEVRKIQFLLEYSMMTYIFLFNDNSFFTRELKDLTPEQLYCIHVALHEYEIPVLPFHNVKPSPLFEALQYSIQYEHDLFLTIIRHIVCRSIAKVGYCQRDIHYMNVLQNISSYKQHDIGVTPVDVILALKIQREYEHIQYKKDTIYKYGPLWQNVYNDNESSAYPHSYFSNLNYMTTPKSKYEETFVIKTNNKIVGDLYLIHDSKKMDVHKEYLTILAILTIQQNSSAKKNNDITVYYDSRLHMHYLSTEYHGLFDPIPISATVSAHHVITGFNKLSSLCSQKIYSKKNHVDKPSRPTTGQTEGENCAENPNIVTSDDYEDANITFESFILEYLHWAAVYGKP